MNCPACNARTDLFQPNCRSCGTILRDKVPNIDFARITLTLVESPGKAVREIFFAEKKNYLLILLFFIAMKNSIIFQSLSAITGGNEFFSFVHMKWTIVAMGGLVLVGSTIAGLIFKVLHIRIKIRQVAALLVFPQIPLLFSFIALTIPEFVIFGKYLFYKEPNIFFIHPNFAWLFLIIEGAIYMWAVVLTFIAFLHIAPNKFSAILFTILALCLMYAAPYYLLMIIPI